MVGNSFLLSKKGRNSKPNPCLWYLFRISLFCYRYAIAEFDMMKLLF